MPKGTIYPYTLNPEPLNPKPLNPTPKPQTPSMNPPPPPPPTKEILKVRRCLATPAMIVSCLPLHPMDLE